MSNASALSGEERSSLERLKISCLSRGLQVQPQALAAIVAQQGPTLTIHEYPTTGGLTLRLAGDVYINAPFDEAFCADADVLLESDASGNLALRRKHDYAPVLEVLPLPGYLSKRDSQGRLATEVAMSHADRIRVSPLMGCAYDCGFCDLPDEKYELRPLEQLIEALQIAQADEALPPRHVLISGGSPRKRDYDAFEAIVVGLAKASPGPVDLMMSPMVGNLEFLNRVVDAGIQGFSINMELHSPDAGLSVLGMKYRTTRRHFEDFIARAVDLLGRDGRVRSLIIPGLEPLEETMRGVEFLAALGCQPTLSPFRPAEGTRLKNEPPPSYDFLAEALDRSRNAVAAHGMRLGPDCIPCQHNTLTFPWDIE